MEILVSQIGCIATYLDTGIFGTPAEIHHLIDPETKRRISHSHTIPLTRELHQGPDGIHHGTRRFREKYGPDMKLLAVADLLVARFESNVIGGAE